MRLLLARAQVWMGFDQKLAAAYHASDERGVTEELGSAGDRRRIDPLG